MTRASLMRDITAAESSLAWGQRELRQSMHQRPRPTPRGVISGDSLVGIGHAVGI
jgi:hypothetical protein